MSGTFKAAGGETWNLIARKATGNDLDADKIRRANPGILEPILAGIVLQVPTDTLEEIDTTPPGDLEITVSSQRIGTFDDFQIARAVDAIAKAGFTVPNEPETRAIFQPLTSQLVTISAGPVLLTGRAASPQTNNSANSKTLDISCYATAGILELAHPPLSAFPLEFTNANLLQISKELCLYHGIDCDYRADSGPLFKRVDIQPNSTVLDFLADLAMQRGPSISSTPAGQLVVWDANQAGNPVSNLVKWQHPVEDVILEIDESKYYSSVTGTTPAKSKKGKVGKSFTVQNPHATDLVRPFEFEATDIDEGELETAVNTMAGRMFAGIVTVTVELSTWLTDAQLLYEPNTTVILQSEEDFIPNPYEFFISNVVQKQAAGSRTASLTLVLPGVYSGQIPAVLPWQ